MFLRAISTALFEESRRLNIPLYHKWDLSVMRCIIWEIKATKRINIFPCDKNSYIVMSLKDSYSEFESCCNNDLPFIKAAYRFFVLCPTLLYVWICWWICLTPSGSRKNGFRTWKVNKRNSRYLLRCWMWSQLMCLTTHCPTQHANPATATSSLC